MIYSEATSGGLRGLGFKPYKTIKFYGVKEF